MTAPDELTRGEYRLFQQAAGHTGFAHVRVDVTRDGDAQVPPQVQWGAEPSDATSAQPDRDTDEVRAALVGVADALNALAASGIDMAGCRVTVTWLGINHVDTEPSAVRAAACAATAAAFGVGDRFEVRYEGGWRCRPRLT
jgi:hypothetical protein